MPCSAWVSMCLEVISCISPYRSNKRSTVFENGRRRWWRHREYGSPASVPFGLKKRRIRQSSKWRSRKSNNTKRKKMSAVIDNVALSYNFPVCLFSISTTTLLHIIWYLCTKLFCCARYCSHQRRCWTLLQNSHYRVDSKIEWALTSHYQSMSLYC